MDFLFLPTAINKSRTLKVPFFFYFFFVSPPQAKPPSSSLSNHKHIPPSSFFLFPSFPRKPQRAHVNVTFQAFHPIRIPGQNPVQGLFSSYSPIFPHIPPHSHLRISFSGRGGEVESQCATNPPPPPDERPIVIIEESKPKNPVELYPDFSSPEWLWILAWIRGSSFGTGIDGGRSPAHLLERGWCEIGFQIGG
ncbi:hypothetical protein IE53DRAFT_158708 [Violaceomyces palustris]|uniref:Uncharacterized protein n=1 Tax=Violaceomyces palustris TaxID=1673888 RepID=A0ACD0P684_9BASI|nr:hypothetical protein IE53DRAFT_158708 [Violaceomyces palustris]